MVFSGSEEVYRSDGSDLSPLLEYIGQGRDNHTNPVIFDVYVGRAAALLMTTVKPAKVFAGVISEGGATVLQEYMIPYEAGKTVKYLMDHASHGMCRWEKMSMDKTPGEFLEEVMNSDGRAR